MAGVAVAVPAAIAVTPAHVATVAGATLAAPCVVGAENAATVAMVAGVAVASPPAVPVTVGVGIVVVVAITAGASLGTTIDG